MLSDEDMRHIDEGRFRSGSGNFFTREEVRDFYERLIANGKLRVVEEVEIVRYGHKTEFSQGEPLDSCSGCGYPLSPDTFQHPDNFCRGCGNKIKR